MTGAIRIIGDKFADRHPAALKNGSVFINGKAGVVNLLATDCAERFSSVRPDCQHDNPHGIQMTSYPLNYGSLVFRGQMKEGIPGNNSVECSGQLQCPHIDLNPLLLRKPRPSQAQKRIGKIGARNIKALVQQPASNGFPCSAAKIKHAATGRQMTGKTL